jgi:MerR family transcriptional regulator, light-induced transcriptional regulator
MSTDTERLTDMRDVFGDERPQHQSEPDFDELDPRLRHAVVNQVIPRLKALNRAIADAQGMHRRIGDPAFAKQEPAEQAAIHPHDLELLLGMLHHAAAAERHHFYDGFVQRGLSFDEICEELIAPAARKLGARWSDDTLSFSEVSASCSSLQNDLLWLAERFQPDQPAAMPAMDAHTALIFAYPGDRHVLAAAMLGESFRQAGWITTVGGPTGISECLDLAASQHYDLIAISVARKEMLPELSDSLSLLRAGARNRGIKIMIGGPAIENYAHAIALGADATSFTGQEAVFQANILLDEMADRIPNRV